MERKQRNMPTLEDSIGLLVNNLSVDRNGNVSARGRDMHKRMEVLSRHGYLRFVRSEFPLNRQKKKCVWKMHIYYVTSKGREYIKAVAAIESI